MTLFLLYFLSFSRSYFYLCCFILCILLTNEIQSEILNQQENHKGVSIDVVFEHLFAPNSNQIFYFTLYYDVNEIRRVDVSNTR